MVVARWKHSIVARSGLLHVRCWIQCIGQLATLKWHVLVAGDFLMVWCFPSVPKALQEGRCSRLTKCRKHGIW